MRDSPDSISREEALAAIQDPVKGSLRVLKALGKQRDIYSKELMAGKTSLSANNPFEEVCAEEAIKNFKEALISEGETPPKDLKVLTTTPKKADPKDSPQKGITLSAEDGKPLGSEGGEMKPRPSPKPSPSFDPASITREEAMAALSDPEKGSLSVLKAVGKQRDLYLYKLRSGQSKLIVNNPFEEVCAVEAMQDFLMALVEEGVTPPGNLIIVRSDDYLKSIASKS
jgi:hypothetical protein